MAKTRDPFDVTLTDAHKKALALYLCDEVDKGLSARSAQDGDVEYWHQLYEQARTRQGKNAPWADAADLTSYLACEKVDALQARIMKTIWTEPVCTVEGWGQAADRAPFVEEFHQWKVEEERLQSVIDRLALQALIEPRALIEIAEGSEVQTQRKRVMASVETDPNTGGQVFDDKGAAVLKRDERGLLVEAGPEEVAAETVVDSRERIRTGPVYRILPYRDSLILPGHARDKEDIWGYAKRFWRRMDEITAKGVAGIYDKAAVEQMPKAHERESDPALQRSNMDVAPQDGGRAEAELWELLILIDLESFFKDRGLPSVKTELHGERWYLTTIHQPSQALLRVQHDDLERSRFVPVILFPRIDRATEGFSFVGHKLLTIIEEHTAVRNLRADRGAMQAKVPIKRMTGALWEPSEQPWGPGAVIDVRDMRELEPFTMPDITLPLVQWEQNCERTAERVAGINDVASGQVATDSRTLGEIQMATEQSFVRMDLIVRRFQEAIEDIFQIRHAILKRSLAEKPDGVDAPQGLLQNLEGRGVSIDKFLPNQKITATLLDGAFKFKPHGSVETADPNRMRQDFVAGLQGLQPLLQAFPMLIPLFQTAQAARAMGRQYLRVFRIPNPQAFLGSPAQDMEATAKAEVMSLIQSMGGSPPGGIPTPPLGGPGMPPPQGLPPGLPPQAAPPMGAPPAGRPM